MSEYKVLDLRMAAHRIPEAAAWFCQKWGVPEQAYLDSMKYVKERLKEFIV